MSGFSIRSANFGNCPRLTRAFKSAGLSAVYSEFPRSARVHGVTSGCRRVSVKFTLFVMFASSCMIAAAGAQVQPKSFRLRSVNSDSLYLSTQPSDNSVFPIVVNGNTVYFITDKGLDATTDGDATFRSNWGVGGPNDSALSNIVVKGDTIAVGVAAPQVMLDGSPTDVGGGLYVSTDDGATWTYTPQSQDDSTDTAIVFGKNVLKELPTETDVSNISYYLAFFGGYLYAANWGGGLRRTTDLGKSLAEGRAPAGQSVLH